MNSYAYLFEGLTVLDPHTLKVRPGVARGWTIWPDGLIHVFDLREDARWSDGRPVTSEDFVYAWRRALDPATAAEYAYMLYPIRDAKAFYETLQKLPVTDSETRAAAVEKAWSEVGVRAEVLGEVERFDFR